MKYLVFGLVLIALAAVPSDAFLCFNSIDSQKIRIFSVPGLEFCPFGSQCYSYRFEQTGAPTIYVRGCTAIPHGYDSVCKYVIENGGDECNTCSFPFCNFREIPLSAPDGEDGEGGEDGEDGEGGEVGEVGEDGEGEEGV